MAIVPYGTAIHEAVKSGDLKKMKLIRKQAEEYLAEAKSIKEAMGVLDQAIAKLERR